MNNIYLGDAYAQIDQIHDKWLADDDGTYYAERVNAEFNRIEKIARGES